MKKIILLIACGTAVFASSQVSIGKSSVSPSVSLEFGSGNKGIVLPWVTSTGNVVNSAEGTLVYNLTDHKVKVKYVTGWKDLSVDATGTTVDPVTGVDGAALQNSLTENNDAKVTIGTVSSTSGILVLGDQDKAMILPKVADPHLNIINPSPGMMVFDSNKKLFAVFNGNVWTFWKP